MLPQVQANFVHTGKVELIFFDLPLQMHPHAFRAAEAAACAGDQGKFWEMHEVLFANQQALAPEQLPGYAEQAGLDVAAFQKCFAGGRHSPKIRDEIRIAHTLLGITGTPAYLLGRRIPGGDKVEVLEIVHSLLPYEDLEKKLNALLASE